MQKARALGTPPTRPVASLDLTRSQAPTTDQAGKPLPAPASVAMQRPGPSAPGSSDQNIARVARVTRVAPSANNDADPMAHITYLASAELRGRGSPSPGYDKASAYSAALMRKYGLEGVNTTDPSGNPYFQTFEFFAREHLHAVKAPTIGPKLFQHGFFIDATTTREEHAIIRSHVQKLPGLQLGFHGLATVDALKQAGMAQSTVQNVVGVVRGTGPLADEYIVLMAHLDHLGASGEQIFFGADDNASGAAALLSALPGLQALQKANRLNRSVIVLLTAAEEQGLVGSRYFAGRGLPGIPISKIKGVYNNDMVGRWEASRMSVGDTVKGKRTFMSDVVVQANERLGERKFATVNRDLAQYENRQDGGSFARLGIPTVFVFEGLSNPRGGGDLNPDYHQTSDTPEKILADNGGEKVRRFRDLAVHAAEIASNANARSANTPR